MGYRYGKVALVVGASSGVGKRCAEYLLSKNYHVYGTSRHSQYTEVEREKKNILVNWLYIQEVIFYYRNSNQIYSDLNGWHIWARNFCSD